MIQGVAYNNNIIILLYIYIVARIDDADSEIIEISITVVPSLYNTRFVIFYDIFSQNISIREYLYEVLTIRYITEVKNDIKR